MLNLKKVPLVYAGMDVLCSDKTGTLTLNKLSINPEMVMCLSTLDLNDTMKMGALSANIVTEEPIDMVLWNSYPERVSASGSPV